MSESENLSFNPYFIKPQAPHASPVNRTPRFRLRYAFPLDSEYLRMYNLANNGFIAPGNLALTLNEYCMA
jgi:hypothetical protein